MATGRFQCRRQIVFQHAVGRFEFGRAAERRQRLVHALQGLQRAAVFVQQFGARTRVDMRRAQCQRLVRAVARQQQARQRDHGARMAAAGGEGLAQQRFGFGVPPRFRQQLA
uniref:Uncharacterized protein n=1 Tax=Mizugakiibacter sediminis TaxID=1475481 RepID=A0A0S6YZ22_9GAMM